MTSKWHRETFIEGGSFDSDELFLMITYSPWERTGWEYEVVGRSAMENYCTPTIRSSEGPPCYFVPLAERVSSQVRQW